MIGGSKMRKNIVGEKDSIRLVSASGRPIMNRPTMAPRNTEQTIKVNEGTFELMRSYPWQETRAGNEI